MFYTTIENQLRLDGSYGLLYDHFDEATYGSREAAEAQALAKFHTICAAAAVSEIPYHSACILISDGRILRQEVFDHQLTLEPIPEPEPKPKPTEEVE